MAYAQLADLPAFYGLYAAFLPPLVAALFGSSHQLATGPVAVVSLMTSTALAPLATAGSEAFIAYAILLSLLVGLFQFLLGVLRLGMVVNFLSHPVVNGFTNAAAIIIATSQLPKLFGVDVDKAEHHYETVYRTIRGRVAAHPLADPGAGRAGVPDHDRAAEAQSADSQRADRRAGDDVDRLAHGLRDGTRRWRWHRSSRRRFTTSSTDYNETLEEIGRHHGAEDRRGRAGLATAAQAHGAHSLEAIDLHAEESRLEVRAERLKHKAGCSARGSPRFPLRRRARPGRRQPVLPARQRACRRESDWGRTGGSRWATAPSTRTR